MTKTIRSAVMAGAAVLALGLSATSANAATATGSATANIVSPLTITAAVGTSLNFGTIVPNATTAGNVVVSTAGSLTGCGGHTCSGTTDAQDFTVTGTANQTVVLTGDTTVVLSSGVVADDMTVALSENASGAGNTFVLGAGGTFTLSFGGTLPVAAAKPAGVYSGTFNVNVDYQ